MNKKAQLLASSNYDPDTLLNALIEHLGVKNDAQLSRVLEVAPPVISKLRHRSSVVGDTLLLRMHDVSNLSIRNLRRLMGVMHNSIGEPYGA